MSLKQFSILSPILTQKVNYWVSIWIPIPTAQYLDRSTTLVIKLNLKTFYWNRLPIANHHVKNIKLFQRSTNSLLSMSFPSTL